MDHSGTKTCLKRKLFVAWNRVIPLAVGSLFWNKSGSWCCWCCHWKPSVGRIVLRLTLRVGNNLLARLGLRKARDDCASLQIKKLGKCTGEGATTPKHWSAPIPGSSFGRKKVPDLNPAKFSAGFRKKRRRPEKTSGSKILNNRDDKRLDHTQGNCLCAASSFSGAHSNLPVPIALAHLPNGLRAEPSQNISNLCPSKDFQEETKEHVAMNSSFSATVSLKCFFTKCMGCAP